MTKRERIAAKFGGRCAYCGCELQKGWCMDHVKPVQRQSKWVNVGNRRRAMKPTGLMGHPERDTEDNLFPACRVCNYAKADMSVEDLRREIQDQTNRSRRDSWNFRMAEKYGLVQVVEKPVVFWFEAYATRPLGQGGEL